MSERFEVVAVVEDNLPVIAQSTERIKELYNLGYRYHSDFSPIVGMTFVVFELEDSQVTVTVDNGGAQMFDEIMRTVRARGYATR